jgi:catechol 2,3-dioxygenase-like lactoylglutathione lyase family enzyme
MLALVQLTVDCADPERLADFWSAAIGYAKVDYSGHYAEHPEWIGRFAAVRRPEEGGPGPAMLHFQAVPEPKEAKNRLHFDLISEDVSGEVLRLERLGATVMTQTNDFDDEWVVMADPEGNEFCVGWIPGTRPG